MALIATVARDDSIKVRRFMGEIVHRNGLDGRPNSGSKNGERRSPPWASLVSVLDARVGQVALELGPEAVHEADMATYVSRNDAGIVQDVYRAIGSDRERWSNHVADIGSSKNFSFGRDRL